MKTFELVFTVAGAILHDSACTCDSRKQKDDKQPATVKIEAKTVTSAMTSPDPP